MINIQTSIFILLFVISLITLIKFWKHKTYRFSVFGGYVLIIVFFTILIFSSSNVQDIPDQIVTETRLLLELEKTIDRNYILNHNEEARYIEVYDKDPKILEDWHPIYLDEIESYYIVIYSKDKDKQISYNRFRQGDYERFKDVDRLVVIHKDTGLIFHTTHYDLIGYEIDLNSFQEGHHIITFNVFLQYEEKISYVRYISYTSDYSIDNSKSFYENFATEPMGGNWIGMIGHTHTLGDPSWVEDFILHNNLYYYEDSYGEAYYGYLEPQGPYRAFRKSYEFTDETYAKQGYLKFVDDDLYFVDNDLNLCYLNGSTKVIVASHIVLENWESYI
jgi:hypothetical protein